MPRWLTEPDTHLAQFLKYAWKAYDLPRRIEALRDGRRRPIIPTAEVVRGLLFTAILRLPSLNAMEGQAKRPSFQRLLGRLLPRRKLFSADTSARVLDSLQHDLLRKLLHDIVHKAERNKCFRQGPAGARRCVAMDGWEAFSSYLRHCPHCLTRQVRTAQGERTLYYHAFVVAWLLGEGLELVLDFEPLRSVDLRRKAGEPTDHHDGEQTAALRLLDRLHAEFGSWLDLFVLDALYANGPMMTRLADHGYGGIITLKKATDEPLKDALVILDGQPPSQQWSDGRTGEHVELWDVDEIETLETYKGKVRILRAEVASSRLGRVTTWCSGIVGARARQLPARTVHRLHRMRWHEENTAFRQWTQLWNLGHVFRHTPGAVPAVLLLWLVAFNLMQLFVFRRLRRPRRPTDPCDTIRDLVAAMLEEMQALTGLVPWKLLLDSS